MKHRHGFDASRRYHDRVAKKYDAIYDDPYWEFHDQLTWEAVKRVLPTDANARCCDLGCGTGKWGLKLLKSGFPTTFVDHSAAMIEQVREKLQANPRAAKARLLVADIVDLNALEPDQFYLTLAMGDPLSICVTIAARTVREMHRTCAAGGVVLATVDNKLAAIEHYLTAGDLDGLEQLIHTGRTRWLTKDERERFELTTFTPLEARKLFERAGFEIVSVAGKTIIPVRQFRELLTSKPDAFDRLMKLESVLARDATAAARAAHLQIAARKPN